MFNGVIKLSEGTAARRRMYFHCVDATDGITPETGEAAGQPQISKNGAAWANTSATLTAIGNGRYYVELTAGEVDTLGNLQGRYKSANTAEAIAGAQVVAYDPFDATALGISRIDAAISSRSSHAAADVWSVGTRALTDKAGFSLSSAGVQAIWDALTSALSTASSIGKLLVDNVNATISSRSTHSAADVWAVGTRTLSAFSFAVDVSAAAVTLIWDKATSALTTVGSIGKLLVDNVNATISSRSSHSAADTWAVGTRALTDKAGFSLAADQSGVTIGTVNALGTQAKADVNAEVDSALDTAIPGSPTANSINERVKTLDDNYTSSRAGNLDNLDASVASRLASSSISLSAGAVTVGTNNDKTGYRLSATGVDDVLDEVVEGSYTFRQYLRLFASALASKLSGAATSTVTIRDVGDTKARITATVDADGNRTAITLDAT